MLIQLELPHLVVFESALFRTCTSLILHEDHLILVDPNWLPEEIEFIEGYIRRKAKQKKRYLFFTHSDYDHIIGYGKFKSYETIASMNFVSNENKLDTILQIKSFDDQYYISRNYPIEYPDINIRVKQESEKMTLGKSSYEFHQATGHNSDGLILYSPDIKTIIAGDYLSNIEFPYVYHSYEKYRQTLNTLEDLIDNHPIEYLVTGHGDVACSESEMRQRIKDSRAYLDRVQNCVMEGSTFDFDGLMKDYQFPIIMRKFHDNNVALAKKEFKSARK